MVAVDRASEAESEPASEAEDACEWNPPLLRSRGGMASIVTTASLLDPPTGGNSLEPPALLPSTSLPLDGAPLSGEEDMSKAVSVQHTS